jgi:hypothetical protein
MSVRRVFAKVDSIFFQFVKQTKSPPIKYFETLMAFSRKCLKEYEKDNLEQCERKKKTIIVASLKWGEIVSTF